MQTSLPISRRTIVLVAIAGILPATATAQSPVQVQPLSNTTRDWLNAGIESPNGRFYAFSSYRGETLAIYDARRRIWTPSPDLVIGQALAWSPDGRFLASVRAVPERPGRYVWLTPVDTATGRPSATPRRISTRIGAFPAWSADGRRIAFVNNDSGTFRILAVPFNGGDEEVLFAEAGRGTSLAWSADGRTIVAAFGKRGFEQWIRLDVASRNASRFPAGSPWPIVGLSRNGQRVANYNPRDNELTISSALDGKVQATYQLPPSLKPAGWSRDGEGFVAAQHIVPSHVQQVRLADGTISALTAPDSIWLGDVSYSPDGSQLLLALTRGTTTQLQIISARGGPLRAVGSSQRTPIGEYAWAPSGKMVVYCTSREVHVLDLASGEDRGLTQLAVGTGSPRPQCGWRKDGTAIRWLRSPGGNFEREHEVHELTPAGADRVIARFTAPGLPYLLDDTLAIVPSRDGLKLRHLLSGEERLVYKGTVFSRDAQWSADRRTLLFAIEEDRGVLPYLLDVRTGAGRTVPYTLGGEIGSVRFHPDGRQLVAYACPTCVSPRWVEKWEVVLIPLSGGPARVLTASQRDYKDHGSPSISPDGTTIAFVGETAYHTRVVKLVPPSR